MQEKKAGLVVEAIEEFIFDVLSLRYLWAMVVKIIFGQLGTQK